MVVLGGGGRFLVHEVPLCFNLVFKCTMLMDKTRSTCVDLTVIRTDIRADKRDAASRTKSPFSGSWIVLELVGIRRLVVQIKATEKDDLLPL